MALERALVKPILYYFPGNKKNPFGHLAIEFGRISLKTPTRYLSYGIGKGKVKEPFRHADGYEYYPSLEDEKAFYQNEVIELHLPVCAEEHLREGITKFIELDRGTYNLINNNCATAALMCLREAGYIPPSKTFSNPLRPQTIAKWISEMLLRQLREERKAIINAEDLPLNKIIKLLKNDVARLQQQIKHDHIAHLTWFKNKDTKEAKIAILNNLIKMAEETKINLNNNNFDNFYQHLIHAVKETSSKTAMHLQECLYLFPKEMLSLQYSESIKTSMHDVSYYKNEREIILTDDEIDEKEMLIKLIRNDISRLSAQLRKDRGSIFGKLKNAEKKDSKIEKLNTLLLLLEKPQVDYDKCLMKMLDLLNDKIMEGKTTFNLQQCVERFPYDKLSKIDEMREFLIKMDPIVDAKIEEFSSSSNSAAHSFFSKMRDYVPKGELNFAISCKEVYEKFCELKNLLTSNADNPQLQIKNISQIALEMGLKADSPASSPRLPNRRATM